LYYPDAWVANRPGLFNGTGLLQRFADRNGSVIDVYQAATQVHDMLESFWKTTNTDVVAAFRTHYDTLLSNAINKGYFTTITTCCHVDSPLPTSDSDVQVSFDCAQAGALAATKWGVPVVSAKQMLDWLQAREATTVTNAIYSNNSLIFDLGTPARNLQLMIPRTSGSRSVISIKRGTTTITWTSATVKGTDYALVNKATAGHYTVTYN
jgi:hypothetical protein